MPSRGRTSTSVPRRRGNEAAVSTYWLSAPAHRALTALRCGFAADLRAESRGFPQRGCYTWRALPTRSEAVAVECARALTFWVPPSYARPTLHAVTRGSHI